MGEAELGAKTEEAEEGEEADSGEGGVKKEGEETGTDGSFRKEAAEGERCVTPPIRMLRLPLRPFVPSPPSLPLPDEWDIRRSVAKKEEGEEGERVEAEAGEEGEEEEAEGDKGGEVEEGEGELEAVVCARGLPIVPFFLNISGHTRDC